MQRHEETLLHILKLKNQHCQVFYDKLKFIHIELPKFTKPLEALETHFDKWLFLLKHLPEFNHPLQPLQKSVFIELFEVAEIANFSPLEQESYQSSLKYYRDLNNVLDTSRQEGALEVQLQEGKVLVLCLLNQLGSGGGVVARAVGGVERGALGF